MRSKLFALFALAMMLWLPASVSAAGSCMCYCGTTSGGAQQVREMGIDACRDTCRAKGEEFVGCYEKSSEYPRFSELCWYQDECEQKAVGYASNQTYDWEDDVAYCEDLGDKRMGYCYAPANITNLIVSIGSDTEVEGVGDYINTMYRFLIPAVALVAVVMFMVAGLQYILARGNPTSVKRAKDRMTNVVVGIILLLSAHAIARLLDPRLVQLEQLRTPVIKKTFLLREDDTCEYLGAIGFTIDGKTGSDVTAACGKNGRVDAVNPDYQSGVWEVGDTCIYSTCSSSSGYKCAMQGSGEYGCISCAQVFSDVLDTGNVSDNGITPSPSMCSSFTQSYSAADTTSMKYICQYVENGPLQACAQVSDAAMNFTAGGAASNGLNCQVLRSDGGSCRSYDTVKANFYFTDALANFVPQALKESILLRRTTAWNLDILPYYDENHGADLFSSICTSDPCGLAPNGTTGCTARISGYNYDCISSKDAIVTGDGGQITGGTCYNNHNAVVSCLEDR